MVKTHVRMPSLVDCSMWIWIFFFLLENTANPVRIFFYVNTPTLCPQTFEVDGMDLERCVRVLSLITRGNFKWK